MSKVRNAFYFYLFSPQSPYTLATFRICVSIVLIFQAIAIASDFYNLYSDEGFLQNNLNGYLAEQQIPFFDVWFLIFNSFNEEKTLVLSILFILYILSLVGLLLGKYTRKAACVSWLFHLIIFYYQGYVSAYGVDSFANIALFYLTIVPSNEVFSFDKNVSNKVIPATDYKRSLSIRIIQCHLAIVYCSSGILKGIGVQWRNGEVIWRSYMLPQFGKIDVSWMADVSFVPIILGWSVLFLEVFYPIGMFWRRSRPYFLILIVGMHFSIGATMGLWSFSLFMIGMNLALFGVPDVSSAWVPVDYLPSPVSTMIRKLSNIAQNLTQNYKN